MDKMFRNATANPPHALTLAAGQPLAPGEDGLADPEDRHDAALIECGDLIPVDSGSRGRRKTNPDSEEN